MMSARLYTGDLENRLKQEILLGIGGAVVLATLGIKYQIMHLNEGHAAFAILEHIRHRTDGGETFEETFEKVRQKTVFTTHTPIPAGHDVFPFHLIDKYFHSYLPALGIERERFFRSYVAK
jgi:starch phosphorylase